MKKPPSCILHHWFYLNTNGENVNSEWCPAAEIDTWQDVMYDSDRSSYISMTDGDATMDYREAPEIIRRLFDVS
jgi:hypothetical protein